MSHSSSRLMVSHCPSMSCGRLGSEGALPSAVLPSAFTASRGRTRSIMATTLVATARCSPCSAPLTVATMPLMRCSHFHISPQPMRATWLSAWPMRVSPLESTRRTALRSSLLAATRFDSVGERPPLEGSSATGLRLTPKRRKKARLITLRSDSIGDLVRKPCARSR
eukprot:scaffold94961_cov68-Phaeocystis_antarctica.AAC.2